MAAVFTIGEQKIRPGVYDRYENYGGSPTAGADDGKCACVLRSNWGPTDTVSILESSGEIEKFYGNALDMNVPREQFNGGAKLVYAVRLGAGGSRGSLAIKNTDDAEVLTLSLKYPGSRSFSVTIRPSLAESGKKEIIILEGTDILEKFSFDAGEDEIESLLSAASSSLYFTLSKVGGASGSLADLNQHEIPPGTDPTVNAAAYSAAFELLEAYRWNVLAIDTEDTAIQLAAKLFINRIFEDGKFAMLVIGENKTVPFETKLIHASSFNDKQVVYVGNGFIDSFGFEYDGCLAAARISGLIAGTPSNESITHTIISDAARLNGRLTNREYESSINSGMLTFSLSPSNTVWVESGINTLTNPEISDDIGWKKIKRAKIRFELMRRLNDTVEPLVGKVSNDHNGRANIIQAANSVCNEMILEGKLLAGAYCELDPANAPMGDSAWFHVFADDIDSLEKIYFTFKFRFSAV